MKSPAAVSAGQWNSDVTVQKKNGDQQSTDLLNFLISAHLIIQRFFFSPETTFRNPQLISCPSPPGPLLENFPLFFTHVGKESLFRMLHKSCGDFHGLVQRFRTSLHYLSSCLSLALAQTLCRQSLPKDVRNAWIHNMTLRTRLTFSGYIVWKNGASSRG